MWLLIPTPTPATWAVVAMTDTVNILDTHFYNYRDEVYPSILYVDETVNRTVSPKRPCYGQQRHTHT